MRNEEQKKSNELIRQGNRNDIFLGWDTTNWFAISLHESLEAIVLPTVRFGLRQRLNVMIRYDCGIVLYTREVKQT